MARILERELPENDGEAEVESGPVGSMPSLTRSGRLRASLRASSPSGSTFVGVTREIGDGIGGDRHRPR